MNNNDTEESQHKKRTTFLLLGSGIGCRRVLNIMVFLGFMVNYMLRVNLTFAIVYMMLPTNKTTDSNIRTNQTTYLNTTTNSSLIPHNRFQRSSEDEDLFKPSFNFGSQPDLNAQQFQKTSESIPGFGSENITKQSLPNTRNFSRTFDQGSAPQMLFKTFQMQNDNRSSNSSFGSTIGSRNTFSTGDAVRYGSDLQSSDGILYLKNNQKQIVMGGQVANNSYSDGEETGTMNTTLSSTKKPYEDDKHDVSDDKQTEEGDLIKGYNKKYNKFHWNEQQQGMLLGSFFWGYVCTELPGGRLAEIIGARSVFGYATLGASIITLLTPLSAKIDLIAVIVLRIILGLLLGPTWPSVLPLASKWIPPNERGKFMSNMMASTLGAAFTLPVCSFIIEASSWEYVFYCTGLIGLIWSSFWFMLVFDSPAEHPRITVQERRYIESQLGLKPVSLLSIDKSDSSPDTSDQEEKQFPSHFIENQNVETNLDTSDEDERKSCERHSSEVGDNNKNVEKPFELQCCKSEVDDKDMEKEPVSLSTSQSSPIIIKNGVIAEGVSPVKSSPSSATSVKRNGSLNSSKRSRFSKSQPCQAAASEPSPGHGHGKAPWLHIISSVPVWAFVFTHTASVFGYNTITVQLPTYMKHILHYDIKSNGILSSLPYLGKYIMAITAGSIADAVLRSKKLSKTATKKLFTALGVLIPGMFMLVQVWLGHDKVFSVLIFTLALTMNGFVTGGYLGNSLDLAPNFSGTVFGLANMFSSAGGALSAIIVGYLTNNNQVYSQWQKVFWIVGCMYIVGSVTFVIFGTTDVQPWNNARTPRQSKVDEINKEAEPLKIFKS